MNDDVNEFSERFMSLEPIDLLKIICNADDYDPLAVEAAEREFESRNLSRDDFQQEIQEFTQAVKTKKLKSVQKENRRKARNEQITKVIIPEVLDPKDKTHLGSDKTVIGVSIFLVILTVFYFISEGSDIGYLWSSSSTKVDLWMILITLPLIYLPITTMLFWMRKPLGWKLLIVYLCYRVLNLSFLLVFLISKVSSTGFLINTLGFEEPSYAHILLAILLFVAIGLRISKKNIRDAFEIDRNTMIKTIAISSAISLVLILLS